MTYSSRTAKKFKWVFFLPTVRNCVLYLTYTVSCCYFKTISQIHKIMQKHTWDMHTIASLKKKRNQMKQKHCNSHLRSQSLRTFTACLLNFKMILNTVYFLNNHVRNYGENLKISHCFPAFDTCIP